jgi:DNA-binding transcriptional LysR family regulator
MSDVRLGDVDLNLLVALDALLEESHVTQAAQRVGLSQSAMSHALRRLRLLFDDPLLVRGRGGMRLTSRALELQDPVRRGLLELQRAIRQPVVFEPSTSTRRFVLVTSDHLQMVMLPQLLSLLKEEAPGVDVAVRPLKPGTPVGEVLRQGVDLSLWVRQDLGAGLREKKMFDGDFACVVREDHPCIQGSISLEQYVKWPHALISPSGQGGSVVASALEKLGHTRRVALEVPSFLAAPLVVSRSNLLLTAPRGLLAYFAKTLPLQLLEPPVELPEYGIYQVWDERNELDPGHKWFRGLMERVCFAMHQELFPGEPMIRVDVSGES